MLLTNPIWLFALAALSIPIAIHLWNIRRGRTLKVGSISLINDSFSKRSRSLKLHDIILLLLRCLLLSLLAFLLALPFIKKQLEADTKGWLLIPKENISESYHKFKPEIDSLTRAGYSFHYFNKGFVKADLNKTLLDTAITNHPLINTASYWSLLQQLDQKVSSSMPVYLFTPNSMGHFTGEKPQIALNLKWRTYSPTDSVNTWIQSASFTTTNDVNVVQGTSKPLGTNFVRYLIKSGDEKGSPFSITVNNGQPAISIKNSDKGTVQTPVNIDTTTLRYAIYADKNSPGASYVMAALKAVAGFTGHKTLIKQYSNSALIPSHQNWIFWLSDKPLDKSLLDKSSNIFSYEGGKVINDDSWIVNKDNTIAQRQQIPLYKLTGAAKQYGQSIWEDGFGRTVLSLDKQKQINIYHFYSRFDPSWNELVWSNDFPKMLLKLMADKPQPLAYDKRAIDEKQLQPIITTEKHTTTTKLTENIDLSRYLWLMIILVLATERWLANKNKILQHG